MGERALGAAFELVIEYTLSEALKLARGCIRLPIRSLSKAE